MLLYACAPAGPVAPTPKPHPAAPSPRPTAPVAATPAPAAIQAINTAAYAPEPKTPTPARTPDPVLIRAEVILDRAGFSPGVIDGLAGSNARKAIGAFQAAQGLPPSGEIDAQTWTLLTRDGGPSVQAYTITPADVAGPFSPNVGEDFVKLAALPDGPLYVSPLQALAERFHMSQALLTALNPTADFSKAGTRLWVAAPGAPALAKGDVKHIVVSKTKDVYDPSKLKWGPRSHGKFVIKPGPEGPVGVVWIDIDAPSFGIHGTPDPTVIGKTASHGCVRLTNWDALALAHGVKPGVPVDFDA